MIEPFRLCLALGPLAVYLLGIGALNRFRRPFLVSGTRDITALGLGLSGLVIAGPGELLFPVAASITFGAITWLLLIGLYGLFLTLVLLAMRPRLVVYNIAHDKLRPVLADLVEQLDPEARWAGDSLMLPSLGVQLHLDSVPLMRNTSLVASGPHQNPQGWHRLAASLKGALREVEVSRNPKGLAFLGVGGLLAMGVVMLIARNPQAMAQSLFDMLRI